MMEIAKKDILLLMCLFLVALLIRAVGRSNVGIYGDEWLYWVDTNRILSSNFAPMADVFDFAPPFLPYIGAVVTLFFGGDLDVLRMISVVFGSLTVCFLYLFGSVMYDRKTGLLSSFLLSFSAYHALYSRIFMLEALTLFFITAFLYFFWISQHSEQRKSIIYAAFAGAMVGLAFDAKYISFFLVPSVIAYVLWTKRFSFKALLDKRLAVMAIFAFLFFIPILICLRITGIGLHPFYFMAIEKFGKTTVGHARVISLPLPELIIQGGGKMLEVLSTWGADTLVLHWNYLFRFSATLVFILIICYYLHNFINREEEGSFLIIALFTAYILVLGIGRMRHYIIYAQPFYYIMFAHFGIKTFNHIERESNYKNIFRVVTILFMGITLVTSFITCVTSPYWDEGDSYPWIKGAVGYVKNDIAKSEHNGRILIGVVDYTTIILDYPFYHSGFDVYAISMLKPGNACSEDIANVDLDRLNIFKPDYLILSEHFYKQYFRGNVKSEIFRDYRIVFHSQTYPHTCFVFKRKNAQPPELVSQTKEGQISQDIFKRSVPNIMEVGKTYTALVQVKNTGDSRTNFTIRVHSSKFIIFVHDEWRSVTLDKDLIHTFEFKIVPFKEHMEDLPITVDLYAKCNESGKYAKVDSFTDYIRFTER